MRVLRSEIWSMIPHIYHRAPSTARVDDGSAPITTSLGRRPKRAAPDRIEDEFQRAVGGIPAIERMREEYHHKYADTPSLHSVIDRIADDMRQRLLEGG